LDVNKCAYRHLSNLASLKAAGGVDTTHYKQLPVGLCATECL